ncbi:hypothetical protein [Bacillus salipaludis]|nr:hypothetical protein [Bacillus salipaludis]
MSGPSSITWLLLVAGLGTYMTLIYNQAVNTNTVYQSDLRLEVCLLNQQK